MKPIESLSDDELAKVVRQAAALHEAPAHLIHAAIGLWPERAPSNLKASAQALVRELRAVLTFDSWTATPAAAGLRSRSSDTRHLLFSAKGRDIDLRVAPKAGQFALAGQVLGPDESGRVELAAQGPADVGATPARAAPLDAMGEFHIDGVGQGRYVLTLRMGDEVIVLPPIDVGVRD
jgi:hypothetical protein